MKFNYIKKGTGPTILMVHGWGGSLESLKELQEKLSKKFTVFFLELPGHGTSEVMDRPWSTHDFLNFVKDFIKDKKLKEFSYIGHSFGGHLGLKLGIEKYEGLQKLILVNTAGLKPRNSHKKLIWKLASVISKPILNTILFPFKKLIKTVIYKFIIRETDYLKTSGMIRESFKKVVNEHLSEDEIQKIDIPTLLIWGDEDTYTPLWMGLKLNELIKSSEIRIHQGTHGLPLKSPEVVYSEIINWLR